MFEKIKVFRKGLKDNILTDSLPSSKFQICWCFKISISKSFWILWCLVFDFVVALVLEKMLLLFWGGWSKDMSFFFFCFLWENIFFSGTYNMCTVIICTCVRCRTSHNITVVWYFLQLNVLYASSAAKTASFQSYLYNI